MKNWMSSSRILTTPFRRLLPRCRRGYCTEARRRKPARGLAPFPTQGWGQGWGGSRQLSPLWGLVIFIYFFKQCYQIKKEQLDWEKCVFISVVDVTEEGLSMWQRPSQVWSNFFLFRKCAFGSTTPLLCCRRQAETSREGLAAAGNSGFVTWPYFFPLPFF